MKKLYRNILCVIAISIAALFFNTNVFGQTYDVNIADSGAQTITGWGGFTDQCGSRAVNIKAAYDAEYNELGLTTTRFRLWSDCGDNQGNINIGSSSSGLGHIYAVWNEARNRGATDWIMSVWECPMGSKLPTASEGAYCTWVVNCLNYLINTKGMPPPKGFAPCNEPVNTLFSDYAQLERVTIALRAKLNSCGISNIASIPLSVNDADSYQDFQHYYGNYNLTNTAYWSAVGIASSHSYCWGTGADKTGPDQFVAACNKYCPGKPRWMTENCSNTYPQPTQLLRAIAMCQQLALDINYCGMSQWYWWSVFESNFQSSFGSVDAANTDCLIDGDGVTSVRRSKTFYALAKLWTSAKVGSVVHKVTSTDPGFKSGGTNVGFFADGAAFVYNGSTIVMLMNNTSAAKTYNVKGLTGTSAKVYQTTSTQDMALVSSPSITGGTLSGLSLPASSISIFVTNGATGTLSTPHFASAKGIKITGSIVELAGKQRYNIRVFDTKGLLVGHMSLSGPCVWRIPGEYTGMYVIKVTGAAGQLPATRKIVGIIR